MLSAIYSLFERRPIVPWIGSAIPTTTGIWTFMEGIQNVLSFVLIIVGIISGILTILINFRNLRHSPSSDTPSS